MEKRAILAFGLSALLLFAYVWVQEQYFTPSAPPKKTTESVPSKDAPPPAPPKASAPAAPTPQAPVAAPAARPADAPAAPRPPQRTARVDAPLYRAVVSSEGGKLQDWMLHYRGDRPMVVVGEFGPGGLTVGAPDAKRVDAVACGRTIRPYYLLRGHKRPSFAIALCGLPHRITTFKGIPCDVVTLYDGSQFVAGASRGHIKRERK